MNDPAPTQPTPPTPPCSECGPFHQTLNGIVCKLAYSREEIEASTWSENSFPCQRCGTIHVLRDGKLERKEKRCPICSSPIPIDRDTCFNLNCGTQQPQPESDPAVGATPRFEVTRYGEMHEHSEGRWVRFEDFSAERAAREAAEGTHGHSADYWFDQYDGQRKARIAESHERDQLRQQLTAAEAERDEWKVKQEVTRKGGKALNEALTTALARVKELDKDIDEWIENAADVQKELSTLRAESVPKKLVEDARAAGFTRWGDNFKDTGCCAALDSALASITKGAAK